MKLLTDTNPGKPRWWVEYAIYKTTGYCDHGFWFKRQGRRGRFVKADEDCKIAWAAEYDYAKNGLADWEEVALENRENG